MKPTVQWRRNVNWNGWNVSMESPEEPWFDRRTFIGVSNLAMSWAEELVIQRLGIEYLFQ